MGSQDSHADQVPLDALRDEFRRHLQLFYSRLKLAPPYDSVEKAVRQLTTSIKKLSSDDQRRLVSDEAFRWAHYRRAFIDSGLSQKHRGIIAGLARQRDALDLPPEFDHFLNVYA